MLSILFSLACTPGFVDRDDVSKAVARGDVDAICVGLSMEDPSVRTYATEQIRPFVNGDEAQKVEDCICQAIPKSSEGWDSAIISGLSGTTSNRLTGCFAQMVLDPKLPNRSQALEALIDMQAPIVLSTMREIAKNENDDPEVRAKALLMVGGDEKAEEAVVLAAKSSNSKLREASFVAIARRPKARQLRKFIDKGLEDENPEVRSAAITAYKVHAGKQADARLCSFMMDDPEGSVRTSAILAFKDVRRKAPVECLNKRAMTLEEDPQVREALLKVLQSAKGDAREPAFSILCDAIPFWLRSYVTDDVVTNIKGAAIVKAQNDVDHENSGRCFAQAYKRSSGYSCYAKMHIALWHAQMIGKEDMPIPLCPDMEEYSEAYE
ncbi:MAG: hypothetical protein CMK59_06830 [Proteobacteria bacterium]|nr:hypothetical protein [Pseudomonadota bacterium]